MDSGKELNIYIYSKYKVQTGRVSLSSCCRDKSLLPPQMAKVRKFALFPPLFLEITLQGKIPNRSLAGLHEKTAQELTILV